MPLTEQQKQYIVQQSGLDPSSYTTDDDGNNIVSINKAQPSVSQKVSPQVGGNLSVLPPTTTDKPLITFGKSFAQELPSAIAGGVGLASGATLGAELGLLGGPIAPATVPIGSLLGALVGAAVAGGGVHTIQEEIEPESWKQDIATSQATNPISGVVGGLATLPFGGFSPSPRNVIRASGALGRLAVGMTPEANELQNLLNVGMGAGLMPAQEVGTSLISGTPMPSIGELARSAAIGAVFNKPNALGRMYGLHEAQSIRSEPDASLLENAPSVDTTTAQPSSPIDLAEQVAKDIAQRKTGGGMIPEDQPLGSTPYQVVDKETGEKSLKWKNKTYALTPEGLNNLYTDSGGTMGEALPKNKRAMKTAEEPSVSEKELTNMEGEGGIVSENVPAAVIIETKPTIGDVIEQQKQQKIAEKQTIQAKKEAALEQPSPFVIGDKVKDKSGNVGEVQEVIPPSGLNGPLFKVAFKDGKTRNYDPRWLSKQQKNSEVSILNTGNPTTALEQQTIQDVKGEGLPHSPTEGWWRFFKSLGDKRNVKLQSDDTIVNQVTGKPIAGTSWLREGINKTLAKINPNAAGPETPGHEIFHPFINDLLSSPRTARDKAIAEKGLKIVSESPDYQRWSEERLAKGLDNSPEEYLTTDVGYGLIRRALNVEGESPLKKWYNDTKAYLKTRWSKHATEDDYKRILTYKLYHDPAFEKVFGGDSNMKVPSSVPTQHQQQNQDDSNLRYQEIQKKLDEYIINKKPHDEEYDRLFAEGGRLKGDYIGDIINNDTVRAKPVDLDYRHEHSQYGMRAGFRYRKKENNVAWDFEPTQDEKNAVTNFIEKKGNPTPTHSNVFDSRIKYQDESNLSQDKIRYDEIQKRMRELMNSGQMNTDEFSNLWKEMEGIKNKTKGMPPKNSEESGLNRRINEEGYTEEDLQAQLDALYANPDEVVSKATEVEKKPVLSAQKVLENTSEQEAYKQSRIKELEDTIAARKEVQKNAALRYNAETPTVEEWSNIDKLTTAVKTTRNPKSTMYAIGNEFDAVREELNGILKKKQLEPNREDLWNEEAKLHRKLRALSYLNDSLHDRFPNLRQQVLSMPEPSRRFSENSGLTDESKFISQDGMRQVLITRQPEDNSKWRATVFNQGEVDYHINRDTKEDAIFAIKDSLNRAGHVLSEIPWNDEKTKFSERSSFAPVFTSRIDKIAEKYPSYTGKLISDKLHKFSGETDLLTGRIGNQLIEATRDYTPKQIERVYRYLFDKDNFGKSSITLTGDESTLSNKIVDILREPRKQQIALGLKVSQGPGSYRQAGIKPEGYMFNMLDPQVAYTWSEKGNSVEAKGYDNAYIQHQIAKGATPEEAAALLRDYKHALGSNVARDVEFGAIRKAEGNGLPWSMVDKNFASASIRYAKRAARDLAFFKHIQNDPETLAALNLRDQFGNFVDASKYPKVDTNISSSPEVQNALRSVFGIDTPRNPRVMAVARVAGNAVMGIGTAGRNILNMPAFIAQYVQIPQLPLVVKALAEINTVRVRAFRNNAIRASFGDFDAAGYYEGNPNPAINLMNKFSQVLRKYQGRDLSDKFEGSFYYSLGELLATSNIAKAKEGNKESIRFVKRFSDINEGDVLTTKKVTQDNIERMAKRFVDAARGTYGEEGLPSWAIEGEFAPFAALSRFSIEKSNTIWKDVIEPMKQGIYGPLLRYTLGSIGVGLWMEELNELLNDKRGQEPKINEIIASGNQAALIPKAISLLQLASFAGIVSDGAKLATAAYQNKSLKYNQPLSFPLYTLATDTIAANISDAIGAVKNGEDPFEVMGGLATAISTQSVQTLRYINAYAQPDETKRKEKFRDLRVFNQLTGKPQPTDDNSGHQNLLADMDLKKFKKTDDMSVATEELPQLLKRAIEKANGNVDILRSEFQKIKQNNYQTMPSPDTYPSTFLRYLNYVKETQGADKATALVQDYMKHRALNTAKSGMVPTL